MIDWQYRITPKLAVSYKIPLPNRNLSQSIPLLRVSQSPPSTRLILSVKYCLKNSTIFYAMPCFLLNGTYDHFAYYLFNFGVSFHLLYVNLLQIIILLYQPIFSFFLLFTQSEMQCILHLATKIAMNIVDDKLTATDYIEEHREHKLFALSNK